MLDEQRFLFSTVHSFAVVERKQRGDCMAANIRALVVKDGHLADFREYARPEMVAGYFQEVEDLHGYEVRWTCPETSRIYQDSALSFLARLEMGGWEALDSYSG
jgi:hypothetical protein